MVSKLVERDEYGKVFTFTSVASSITELITSSGFQEIYAATIDIYPGAFYLFGAGLVTLALVSSIFKIYKTIKSKIIFGRLFR